MKTLYWKPSIIASIFLFNGLFSLPSASFAQCPTDLLTGQNLLTNGDFSQGYTGWTFTPDSDGNPNTPAANSPNGYIIFNPPTTQNYSQPGFIYANTTPNIFNAAFINFNDHTSTADNMMLMVDGVCSNGIKLWSQTGILIKPNTNYYFSIWVHALKDNNNPPGTLQFDINGINLATTITVPTSIAGGWVQYETTWNSGASPTSPGTISIENTTITGCDQYVDFAIDDITFIPGCAYGAPGPQPNLGADRTICGTGGSITLNANVPVNSTTTVTWSDGTTGTGMSAPYSKNITAAGTYSVCVSDNGSCTKSDVIVISNTYTVELGGPYTLCNPISQTLDAQHTGAGVTYQWYKEINGTAGWQAADTIVGAKSRTYTATSAGTYRVVVTDPSCLPAKEDQVVITSTATATPVDAYFCPTGTANLAVTGTGTYNWYAAATGGSVLAGGSNTSTYTTPSISTSTTYYVEDVRTYNTTVGANTLNEAARNQTQLTDKYMIFDAKRALTIDSVTVYFWLNNVNAGDPIQIQFRLYDNPTNSNTVPTTLATGPSFSMTNSTANAAGLISPAWGTKADGVYAVRVPVKLSVTTPGMYRLGVATQNPTNSQIQTSGAAYNYNDNATNGNVITINSSKLGTNPFTTTEYHGMFRWKILYSSNCGRTPVRAIANCVLPVEYLNFTAVSSLGSVLLSWTTATEENNGYFIIERSADGINFESIGRVEGKGNSNSISNYSFTDYNAVNGIVYYRLLQYDTDGARSYSSTRTVNTEKDNIITIHPNPTSGNFNLSFTSDSEVKIFLLNTLGEIVYQEIVIGEINYSRNINIQHLSSGIYFLHLQYVDQNSISKIVKE